MIGVGNRSTNIHKDVRGTVSDDVVLSSSIFVLTYALANMIWEIKAMHDKA